MNADVFATAVRIAGIPEPTSSELKAAAKEAFLQNGRDVCCELIELDRSQLGALCLIQKDDELA
jgi:hypothetical protein